MTSTQRAVIGMLEEGNLYTLGLYGSRLLDSTSEGFSISDKPPLLPKISYSSKAKLALKHLVLTLGDVYDDDIYDMIRSQFPSLETLTLAHFMDMTPQGILDPSRGSKWNQYSNLTRLQFKDCLKIYSSQISHLVRHSPSLMHLLVSAYRDDKGGDTKPKNWYEQKDALWKVRKPLESLHLEYMRVAELGDIPTKTLILTNPRGDFLTDSMTRDAKIFPGLRRIRIQPQIIPEYKDRAHPFNHATFMILEAICQQRQVSLLQDAEATKLFPRHGY